MEYPRLFSSITIRRHEIPNRVVLAPMGTKFNNHDGSVSERYVNYMRARAQGGAGLLITENTHLRHEYTQTSSMGAYHDRLICGMSRLSHAVHPFGSKIILQISIHGGTAQERVIGTRPVAPSAIESPLYPQIPRELSIEEIEDLIDAYVQGAWRGWQAGFDGVEVHAAHGYLLTQFVSPHTNHRTDAYGGNFENRMRAPSEIANRIRKVCGEEFIIGFKYNGNENITNGVDPSMACRIGRHMEEVGIDYLHVASLGGPIPFGGEPIYPSVPSLYTLERNPLIELAEKVKAEVAVPVIAAGGFNRPEDAEAALERKSADLVAVGRAFLADSNWGYKARHAHPENIRPCIKCNQCHLYMIKGHLTRCAINPSLGELDERRVGKTDRQQRIAVVGSGPGGLEAAITAAERGHEVTLYEKEPEIGGNLRIGSLPFFKHDLRRYFDYLRRRLEESHVVVELNRDVTIEYLEDFALDVIIVASGAKMVPLNLPGGDQAIMVVDALSDQKSLGERVILLGAGFVGCEVGWHLAQKGHRVQLIDILPKEKLLEHEHSLNRTTLLHQLRQAGVPIECNATPIEISDQGVIISYPDGGRKQFAADSIVSCFGFIPHRELYEKLKSHEENRWDVHAIGDCVKIENFYHAIQSAFQLVCRI